MSTPAKPALIYLLPALEAPHVTVLRRKPRGVFHILKWDTRRDTVESGSWFSGQISLEACDVSFDGKWLVYSARGRGHKEWSGVCQPPWLRTVVHDNPNHPGLGGGFWMSRSKLCLGYWDFGDATVPFWGTHYTTEPQIAREVRSGVGFLVSRLRRDGWERDDSRLEFGDYPAKRPWIVHDEWTHRPSRKHPTLRIVLRPRSPRPYSFALDGEDGLLDEGVTWATWDCRKNLLFARTGVLYRFDLKALRSGDPSFILDLEPLHRGAPDE